MRVRIFLQENVRTFTRTVVGFVFLWRDNPVPAEFDEIHRQRIAAAASFGRIFVTIETHRSFGSMFATVRRHHLNEWDLQGTLSLEPAFLAAKVAI